MLGVDLSAWNESSWAAAAAWATVLVYVVLAIYAIKQVGEARTLREAQVRPYVLVDFDVNWLTRLYIENIGQTVARDVQVTFDPPLASTMSQPWPWEESTIFHGGIPTLPPGKRVAVYFDTMIERLGRTDLPLTYSATVTYRGISKQPYTDDYTLDLGMYNGTPPPPDAMPELVKAVEELTKEVKKWTDGTNGLRVKAENRDRSVRYQTRSFHLQRAQRVLKEKGVVAAGKHLVSRALERRGWIR